MVGGGEFGLSQKFDSNVYVVGCGEELAMIDAGAGVDVALIEENIKKEGLEPAKITRILLTHSHSDHAGGRTGFMNDLNLRCIFRRKRHLELRAGKK